VQLGLLAERQGDYATAATQFGDAIDREDRNWQWYYLLSRVQHEAGEDEEARANLARARELNPLSECLQGGWPC